MLRENVEDDWENSNWRRIQIGDELKTIWKWPKWGRHITNNTSSWIEKKRYPHGNTMMKRIETPMAHERDRPPRATVTKRYLNKTSNRNPENDRPWEKSFQFVWTWSKKHARYIGFTFWLMCWFSRSAAALGSVDLLIFWWKADSSFLHWHTILNLNLTIPIRYTKKEKIHAWLMKHNALTSDVTNSTILDLASLCHQWCKRFYTLPSLWVCTQRNQRPKRFPTIGWIAASGGIERIDWWTPKCCQWKRKTTDDPNN